MDGPPLASTARTRSDENTLSGGRCFAGAAACYPGWRLRVSVPPGSTGYAVVDMLQALIGKEGDEFEAKLAELRASHGSLIRSALALASYGVASGVPRRRAR